MRIMIKNNVIDAVNQCAVVGIITTHQANLIMKAIDNHKEYEAETLHASARVVEEAHIPKEAVTKQLFKDIDYELEKHPEFYSEETEFIPKIQEIKHKISITIVKPAPVTVLKRFNMGGE